MTELGLTPSQTVGPYLGIGLLGGPITNRLVDESDPRAIRIRACSSTAPEIPCPTGWSRSGRRTQPAGTRIRRTIARRSPLEDGFTGFGRSGTEDAGRFEFVTVKPGRVPWVDGRLQAPHLLVGVFARGLLKRVATRLYFPDEEAANAEDPVLLGLEPEERATLVARAEDDALRFDIVLQGAGQTTFFAV